MRRYVPAWALALLLAAPASAQYTGARTGEAGILDVPDAEVYGVGSGFLAGELRLDRVSGQPTDFGPLPVYMAGGLGNRLDLGFTTRRWGEPGDAVPARTVFGTAAKLQLVAPTALLPGAALSFVVDRLNASRVYAPRVTSSIRPVRDLRAAAFVGAELGSKSGLALGGALAYALLLPFPIELQAEYLYGPRGQNVGAAVLWRAARTFSFTFSVNYLPGDHGFRTALAVAFTPASKPLPPPAPPKAAAETPEEALALHLEERPRFRLKIHLSGPDAGSEPRHRQHGERAAVAEQLPSGPTRITTPTAAGPSAEDVFESQLRDQEASLDARDRRLKATEDSLRQREAAAVAENQQREARDQQLAAREVQLDAREKRIVLRGPPTQAERAIEAREAQLGTQERQLAAQERGFQPTLDAAAGRERDAAAREESERAEAQRLGDEWKRAKDRVAQLDLRRQASSARQRQLGATEARLLAMGERIDALERQARTRAEKLDVWERRLDARAERLEAIEKRSTDLRKTEAKPAEPTGAAEAKPGKEKAVFVMVVKAPTAIMKEQAPGTAPAAGPTGPATAATVEKAVAAATVVAFPTPQSELSELDRDGIDNIAKLAAKENCEVLIWARAKNPSLTAEANRRAEEIKKRVLATGSLDARRVVTRVTTRPGAVGVDVVVSALRETGAKAAPATPSGAPTPAAGQAPIQLLGTGETGKRQIRDSVLRAQPAIEACVGDQIQRKKLTRAEGVLKLTVAANGKVVLVKASEGDLAGAELETCLTEAAKTWQFPAAEGEYVVDVPITVIGGGAAK